MSSGRMGESILDRIGRTPLLSLTRRLKRDGVELLAKAEWFNPGGSVKDRPVLNIIAEAEASGELTRGKVILDASSGNAGISYAMIGAAKGYRVKLCIPSKVSTARKNILKALGAEIVFTNPSEGSDGAIRKARELYREEPGRYFYGDQYSNEANWKAHYLTTGPEIIEQTRGRVTHFVAGVGTSGTLFGTGMRLREFNPGIQLVEVQPSTALHGIEGLKFMDTSIRPTFYDPGFANEKIGIETEEAQSLAMELGREGLLVGTSAAANLAAATRVANRIDEGVVVTIFPDSAERYLSEVYWQESLSASGAGSPNGT